MVLAASSATVPTRLFSRTEIAWSASCLVGVAAKPLAAQARRRAAASVGLRVGIGSIPRLIFARKGHSRNQNGSRSGRGPPISLGSPMSLTPDDHFDHTVLDMIERSPIGA